MTNPPQQPPAGWSPPPQTPAAPRKPRAGLVIGLIAGAVAFLCLCGGVVAVLISAAGEDPSVSTTDQADPGQPDDAGEPEAKAKTAKLGEPARDGKFEFTITKVDQDGRKQIGNDSFGAKAQGEYVFVHATVKNIGDEPQSFFGDNQKLFSGDGKEYSADTEAAIYLKDSESLWEEINPGNKVKGIIVFDVPKGTKLARLELHDSSFSGGVAVKL